MTTSPPPPTPPPPHATSLYTPPSHQPPLCRVFVAPALVLYASYFVSPASSPFQFSPDLSSFSFSFFFSFFFREPVRFFLSLRHTRRHTGCLDNAPEEYRLDTHSGLQKKRVRENKRKSERVGVEWNLAKLRVIESRLCFLYFSHRLCKKYIYFHLFNLSKKRNGNYWTQNYTTLVKIDKVGEIVWKPRM